jgi:hypothetical protein
MSERESGPEPILLFRDDAYAGGWRYDGGVYIDCQGYRRAKDGWLAEAVERVKSLLKVRDRNEYLYAVAVSDDAIRSAILGAAPQPETVDFEIARAVVACSCTTPFCVGCWERARKVARARAAEGRKP